MVLFAGFPKKGKHHEPLKHTNMQRQRRMPRKQNLRYRNYATAAKAAAILLLCSRTQNQRYYAAAAMPLLAAYPEHSSGVLFVGC